MAKSMQLAMATKSKHQNLSNMMERLHAPRFVRFIDKCYTISQTAAYTSAFIVVVAFFITVRSYNNEVYTMQTDYLGWVTRVPAFTVCPSVNGRFVAQQYSKFSKFGSWPQNVSFPVNLLRPGKKMCLNCPAHWPPNLPYNLTDLMTFLTTPCETQFVDCYWNGKPFSCCQHFQPLMTKNGLCYSLNSEQTDGGTGEEPFDMVTSIQKPEAKLEVIAHTAFSVYISDRKVVTMKKPRFPISLGETGVVQYKFTETIALDSAWELTAAQRECVLQDEIRLPGYRTYSYSACQSNCLASKQIEICGCRHHLLRGTGPVCAIKGLQCLDHFSNNFTKVNCSCKDSCTGQDIEYVDFFIKRANDVNKAIVEIILTKPPTERAIYYAQTTLIDSIVGFACMTRLITTANLYEAVEAFRIMIRNYSNLGRFLFSTKVRKI